MLSTGSLIADKYEIRSVIGAGGMGVVYEAYHRDLDRVVALKMLTAINLQDEEEHQRFEREGFILSKLTHKNIVAFYSYGIHNLMPFIAMERLHGRNLGDMLADGPALDEKAIFSIARQICDGLQHAHASGIFHRDLKPSNVVLEPSTTGDTTVKLVDFGLAKLSSEWRVQKLTRTGIAVGSVQYMSPEQCLGQAADARSDIYAFGCLLFHMISGAPPYEGEHSVSLMYQHMNQSVRNCPGWTTLSEAAQAIVGKCLEKDADQRYQSVATLSDDLREIEKSGGKLRSGEKPSVVAPTPTAKPKRLKLGLLVMACTLALVMLSFLLYIRPLKSPDSVVEKTSDIGRLVGVMGPDTKTDEYIRKLEDAISSADAGTNEDNLVVAYSRLADYYLEHDEPDRVRRLVERCYQTCRRSSRRCADEFVKLALDYYCASVRTKRINHVLETLATAFSKLGEASPDYIARARLLVARMEMQGGKKAQAASTFKSFAPYVKYCEQEEVGAGMDLAQAFGCPTHVYQNDGVEKLPPSEILAVRPAMDPNEAIVYLRRLNDEFTWRAIKKPEVPALEAALQAVPINDYTNQFFFLAGIDQLQRYYQRNYDWLSAAETIRYGLERCPPPRELCWAQQRYVDLAVLYRSLALMADRPGESARYLKIAEGICQRPQEQYVFWTTPLARLQLLRAADALHAKQRQSAQSLFRDACTNLYTLATPVEIAAAWELAHEFGVPAELQCRRALKDSSRGVRLRTFQHPDH